MTRFFRLVGVADKGAGLADAIRAGREGKASRDVFFVSPKSFSQVPGSPFAYWVSDATRELFKELQPFEAGNRTARVGLGTTDDFRFLRTWWEVPSIRVDKYADAQADARWLPFAKGGAYSPIYADIPLVINWRGHGSQLKAKVTQEYGNYGKRVYNEGFFGRPGMTWPLRAVAFSPQALPAGCIFSVRGYAAFASKDELPALIGLGNSRAFDFLFKIMLGRFEFPEFVVGVLQKVPVPRDLGLDQQFLATRTRRIWSLKRSLDTASLTSHAFVLPALLQVNGDSLSERANLWATRVAESESAMAAIKAEIDERCFGLYGFKPNDRSAVLAGTNSDGGDPGDTASEELVAAGVTDAASLAAALMDWLVGVAFGHFNAGLTGRRRESPEPDPFDPLPALSPGMLAASDDAQSSGSVDDYPITWPEDRVLVDDSGMGDAAEICSITHRVRRVIEFIWGENATDTEHELRTLLGVRELRDYLRKPTLFFDGHLRRYSTSGRKAPAYWPLSTQSGGYVIWVYYRSLNPDTLYKITSGHLGPRIAKVEDRIAQLESEEAKREGREASRATKELTELAQFLVELKQMREELLRIANLPYQPDLNDGVQITAAPLWRLFRLPRWRSELEKTWKALEKGEYDWAHVAYAIWPDRVNEKCRTDKSLAIAHGVESLYVEPRREGGAEASGGRRKRGGRR